MKIVLIEDEKPAARLVIRTLAELGYSVEVVLYSVAEAIQWFERNPKPDLILADIQLADGLSFDVFEQTKTLVSVIFITAFDHYAIKAFKLNSVDYLLKPIDKNELCTALDKFKLHNISSDSSSLSITTYLQQNKFINRFMIRIGMQIKLISIDQVVCVFREDRGVYIQTIDSRSYLLEDNSVEAVFEKLDPKQFFRINRKQVISLDYIEQIVQMSNARLKIMLKAYNEEVIVSRERVGDFKLWLATN